MCARARIKIHSFFWFQSHPPLMPWPQRAMRGHSKKKKKVHTLGMRLFFYLPLFSGALQRRWLGRIFIPIFVASFGLQLMLLSKADLIHASINLCNFMQMISIFWRSADDFTPALAPFIDHLCNTGERSWMKGQVNQLWTARSGVGHIFA